VLDTTEEMAKGKRRINSHEKRNVARKINTQKDANKELRKGKELGMKTQYKNRRSAYKTGQYNQGTKTWNV